MLKIHIVPCLSDNYAYILHNENTDEAILIDVPEAAPIKKKLKELGAHLSEVLITHHHFDHVDGLDGLDIDHAAIYGAKIDAKRLPKLDVEVESGNGFALAGSRMEIFAADGHTIGHIAYYFPEEKALFSADSLMLWGCGRLFEGSPAQMLETLDRFAALPDDTRIYSGHNYGVGNGKFALSLGYAQNLMEARMKKIEAQNATNEPVVPSTLAEEKATNPFLMARNDELAEKLGISEQSAIERFAHIRAMKDNF